MSSKAAIHVESLGKCYQLYTNPKDRLKQFLWRGKRQYFREFWALHDVSFDVMPGEVVGIIGRNGSGKSTLLQLVCGTLTPTVGEVAVKGRVAALLELGAGFNPEFSGSENVFMSAAIMGLSQEEIVARYEDIVEFSGIRDFIDQPVKTYSSGMYVRLAFSVAISVDPDILVIDEALSVGDGEFARKSFDRIMALKDAGKTILFCSHSMYQIEALCSRAIWIDQGIVRKIGEAGMVTTSYNNFINFPAPPVETDSPIKAQAEIAIEASMERTDTSSFTAHLTSIELAVNDMPPAKQIIVASRQDQVSVSVAFASNPNIPSPSVGIVFSDENERVITSAGSHIDNIEILRSIDGSGAIRASFPAFPLLKGEYFLYVFLLCERGVQVYDFAHAVAKVTVQQHDIEQGVVSIPHTWHFNP